MSLTSLLSRAAENEHCSALKDCCIGVEHDVLLQAILKATNAAVLKIYILSTNDLREDALVSKTHVLLKQKEARHGNASLSLNTAHTVAESKTL
jgi:hypothetical protein